MVEQLFGSKTRVKLLQLFYSNPNRSFYVREITRKIDEQINSVRRELSNLLSIGIIKSETTNNRLYYEVNQAYELHEPLTTIFGNGVSGMATKAPAVDSYESMMKSLGNVEVAILTGQFTRDETVDTDVLIVGDVNQTKLNKFMTELEATEHKELRFTLMNPAEFTYRRQINDRFLTMVLHAKNQVIIDKHSLLVNTSSDVQHNEGLDT